MKLKNMEEVRIEIEQIKNLKAVYYIDISSSNNNMMTIIPALMIVYDNQKVLCLSLHDKYFEAFYQKVREVYLKEKDEVLEDDRTDPFKLNRKIKMDALTEKILLQGNIDTIDKVYHEYSDDEAYNESLLFREDQIKPIIPILKYHIIKVLGLLDKVVSIPNNSYKLYQNYLSFCFNIDGNPMLIPVYIEKFENNKICFKIAGLFDQRMVTTISIGFCDDGIKINVLVEDMDFLDSYFYHVRDGKVVLEHQTFLQNEMKILETVEMGNEKYESNNLLMENFNWYKLPWGALYGVMEDENRLNPNESIVHSHYAYLEKNEDLLLLEFISKRFQRRGTKSLIIEDLVIDSMSRKIIGVKMDNTYLIETSFLSRGMSGYYKEHLEGKYFYSIVEASEVEKIDMTKRKTISKEKGFITKCDLLRREKMKVLISEVK